jgi:hypothetical protein
MATKSKAPTKADEALAFARRKAAEARDWRELHNALYGIGGKLGELFPTQAGRARFAKTEQHREIVALLEQLQGEEGPEPLPEASGRFVLRLPRSLHAALMEEAKAEGISLNQLCVAKLATQLRAAVR